MRLKISEYTFFTEQKSDISFAFVSDLHNFKNEPIFDAISGLGVDAILVGGDFIHNNFISFGSKFNLKRSLLIG